MSFATLIFFEIIDEIVYSIHPIDQCSILPNFEPIQAFITILVTCKYEYDPTKNEGPRVLTTLYIHFLQTLKGSYLSSWWWQKIKLIKALIVVLDTCKKNEDPSKNEEIVCSQHYSHYKSTENFLDIKGQLTP